MLKIKYHLLFTAILVLSLGFSVVKGKRRDRKNKIIYKYKKHEKFEFGSLEVEGEQGSPGDLSSHLREETRFKNKLPYRVNFHPEMRRSIERVR